LIAILATGAKKCKPMCIEGFFATENFETGKSHLKSDRDVISKYFEPFEHQNITLSFAYKSKDPH
jgi:hypothetical protein